MTCLLTTIINGPFPLHLHQIFALLFVLTGLTYAVLVFSFFVGWNRLPIPGSCHDEGEPGLPGASDSPASSHRKETMVPFISVVVAARNEAGRIGALLQALGRQDYPADRFEAIVVDDHSGDYTSEVVSNLMQASPVSQKQGDRLGIRAIKAADYKNPPGKKHALALGISHASGDIILTTDADCIPGAGWIGRMAGAFSDPATDMVMGPVKLCGSGSFGQLQELEFMSLMGTTGGAAGLGNPVMCNGASLGFRKQAWLVAGGYTRQEKIASGDDMFLMHALKKRRSNTACLPDKERAKGLSGGNGKPDAEPQSKRKNNIVFIKHPDAVVETGSVRRLTDFFRQRGRWAGKAAAYTDCFTLLTGAVVAGFNILLAFALVFFLVNPGITTPGYWIVATILVKAFADFLLLFSVAGFFGLRRRLVWFPVLFLAYPLYVVTSIAVGLLRKNKW
jgi:poly-beta-1,6-N-acetyl-D-glucosamine synthase